MPRILILFAHPAFQKSRVNRELLKAVQGIPEVTVHDLYEAYPDFHIHTDYEQQQLEAHDVIVFQHPFYWYSCPALLKEWMDLVLAHGFAYGEGGNSLAGKLLLNVITAGGSEQTYQEKGILQISRQKLLLPFTRMSRLCQMTHLPPFVVFGTHTLDHKAIQRYGEDYVAIIQALQATKVDAQKCNQFDRINQLIPMLRRE